MFGKMMRWGRRLWEELSDAPTHRVEVAGEASATDQGVMAGAFIKSKVGEVTNVIFPDLTQEDESNFNDLLEVLYQQMVSGEWLDHTDNTVAKTPIPEAIIKQKIAEFTAWYTGKEKWEQKKIRMTILVHDRVSGSLNNLRSLVMAEDDTERNLRALIIYTDKDFALKALDWAKNEGKQWIQQHGGTAAEASKEMLDKAADWAKTEGLPWLEKNSARLNRKADASLKAQRRRLGLD